MVWTGKSDARQRLMERSTNRSLDRSRFVEEASGMRSSRRENSYESNEMDWSNQRSSTAVTEQRNSYQSQGQSQGNMTLHNYVIEEKIVIEQIDTRGARLAEERRLAIEEKYRVCSAGMEELLDWLTEIEKRLAMQENVKETWEEVQRQFTLVKTIREDILSHSEDMTSCLDLMRELVSTGADVISADKLTILQRNGTQLKIRYDRASEQSQRLFTKLKIASDELKKYKTEATTFTSWMEKSIRILEDKERNVGNLGSSGRESTKAFVSDVIAHQGDLRFITMSAQKFLDESREYLQFLNEYRTNLPQRLPVLGGRESLVRREVQDMTTTYQDLLGRANRLMDKLSRLGNRQKEFQDALDKAIAWLKEISPRVQKVLSEPVASEPRLIEDQLARAKALQNEVLSGGKIIQAVRQATNNLLNSMEELSPSERAEIEEAASGLEERYQELIEAMNGKIRDLDSALAQSQEIQDAVDGVANWMSQAENQLRLISKPASLIRERLDEQMREVKILQADVDSKRPSIENMARAADELLRSGGERALSRSVEAKLKDVLGRYENLVQKLVERTVHLNQVSTQLDSFNHNANHFDQWFLDMFQIIDTKLVGDNASAILDQLMRRKDEKRREFDEMIGAAKTLVSRKDVTDTTPAKDKIKGLETQWEELTATLNEKKRLIQGRLEHLNAYEKLRDQVNRWLSTQENRINNLRSVGVDLDLLRQQTEEVKGITKEWREYKTTIDKVNELGNAYDAILRSTRGSSTTTSLRRRSSRSPSPSKQESIGGGLEDSPVQAQLNEINHRYGLIGMKLSDRQNEIDAMLAEIKKITDNLKGLIVFLDRQERLLPKDTVPQNREEAENLLRTLQRILEDLYTNQGLLDTTRSQVTDLLRRKPEAKELHRSFQEIEQRWKKLQEICKGRIAFLENMKEFLDSYHSMNNWLNGKEKMLSVLGPIAADPSLAKHQLEQVRVMRDEFRAQKPVLDNFNGCGEKVLEDVGVNSPDGRKVDAKLTGINEKWNDLLGKLDDRERSLDAAAGASSDFYNSLNKLQDNLNKISDGLDDLVRDKGKVDPEELMRRLNALDKGLQGQRPLLAQVEAAGLKLIDILGDPIATADIQKKLGDVARLFNDCQKKLDNLRADLENNEKEVADFEAACGAVNKWLEKLLSQLGDKLSVSAERDILKKQLIQSESLYKEVMSKEQEIALTINKGKQLASSKNTRKSDGVRIQQNIEMIQRGWDRLTKEVMERQTRLHSCMDLCKKFWTGMDSFLPWLGQVENKLSRMDKGGVNVSQTELDKMIRELKVVKEDVVKHTKDYDSCQRQGQIFLSACDKDKEGVKEELRELKERWDKLHRDLDERQRHLDELAKDLNALARASSDFYNNLNKLQENLNKINDGLDDLYRDKGKVDPEELLKRLNGLDKALQSQRPLLAAVHSAGDKLSEVLRDPIAKADIHKKLAHVDRLFDECQKKLDNFRQDLENSRKDVADFESACEAANRWLDKFLSQLADKLNVSADRDILKKQLIHAESMYSEVMKKEHEIIGIINQGKKLMSGMKNSRRNDQIKQNVDKLQRSWDRVHKETWDRQTRLQSCTELCRKFWSVMDSFLPWLGQVENRLSRFGRIDTISTKSELDGLVRELNGVKDDIAKHTKEYESCQRQGQIFLGACDKDKEGVKEELRELKERWDRLHAEILAKAKQLKEAAARLNAPKPQPEKVFQFSWDDWRKRFLKFMNHNKPRVMDLFKPLDRHKNGLIPREKFIDAIMKTQFPTSRGNEMIPVADMFDHGDDLVDYPEFIAALRADWEEKKAPPVEQDAINDEIQRQVQKCTCRQKFLVLQVGEGKYRFGESQKLRLVRILRSTVMVRVGGGWVSLDEFLLKNDPCRAKGRTNIELREQFILADGVSQTMSAFKSKPSKRGDRSVSPEGIITKVRERSIKSLPMSGRGRSSERSTRDNTPGSFSEEGGPGWRTPTLSTTTTGVNGLYSPRGTSPGLAGNRSRTPSGSNVTFSPYGSRLGG